MFRRDTWPEIPRGSLHKSSQIPVKRTTLATLMGQHGECEADFVSLALSLLADQSDVLLQSRAQMVLDIHYPIATGAETKGMSPKRHFEVTESF